MAATSYADNPELLVRMVQPRRYGASAATADAGDSVAGRLRCVAGGPPAPRPRGPPRQDGACHLRCAAAGAGRRRLMRPALRHPGRCVLPLVDEIDALPADVSGLVVMPCRNSAAGRHRSPTVQRCREPSPSSAAALAAGDTSTRSRRPADGCAAGCGSRPETIDRFAARRDSGRRGHRRRIHRGLHYAAAGDRARRPDVTCRGGRPRAWIPQVVDAQELPGFCHQEHCGGRRGYRGNSWLELVASEDGPALPEAISVAEPSSSSACDGAPQPNGNAHVAGGGAGFRQPKCWRTGPRTDGRSSRRTNCLVGSDGSPRSTACPCWPARVHCRRRIGPRSARATRPAGGCRRRLQPPFHSP